MWRTSWLIGIGLAVLLAGCTSMTGETLGQNVDDTGITTSVKAKLAAEKVGTLTRVDVQTTQGVVSLNGVVQTAELKARAGELAWQVEGVREVLNNIQIQKSSS